MRVTKLDKKRALNHFYGLLGIYSISDIKRKHKGYWFSPDTLRFFSSRICEDIFPTDKGVYFITSERKGFSDYSRAFTVRFYNPATDNIDTVGEFLGYDTKAQAASAALNAAYNDVTVNLDQLIQSSL